MSALCPLGLCDGSGEVETYIPTDGDVPAGMQVNACLCTQRDTIPAPVCKLCDGSRRAAVHPATSGFDAGLNFTRPCPECT
jgi:hypothetical protein